MPPLPSAALARGKLLPKEKVRVPSQAIWEEISVFNFAADANEIVNSYYLSALLARTLFAWDGRVRFSAIRWTPGVWR
jgi:hypothetical protein